MTYLENRFNYKKHLEEILIEIEKFRIGKTEKQVEALDELIDHLQMRELTLTPSSEFGPINSTKCKYCGK